MKGYARRMLQVTTTAVLVIGIAIVTGAAPASAVSKPGAYSLAILARARSVALQAGTAHVTAYVVAHALSSPGTKVEAREWIKGWFFAARPLRYSMKANIAYDRSTSSVASHQRFTYQLIVNQTHSASLTTKTGWRCRKTGLSDVPPASGAFTSVVMPGLTRHIRQARFVGATTALGVPVYHLKVGFFTAYSQQDIRQMVQADEYISQKNYQMVRLVAHGTARLNGSPQKFTIFERFNGYGQRFSPQLPPQCPA